MPAVQVLHVDLGGRRVTYRINGLLADVLKTDDADRLRWCSVKAWSEFTIFDDGNVVASHLGSVVPTAWPDHFAMLGDKIVVRGKGLAALAEARRAYEAALSHEPSETCARSVKNHTFEGDWYFTAQKRGAEK